MTEHDARRPRRSLLTVALVVAFLAAVIALVWILALGGLSSGSYNGPVTQPGTSQDDDDSGDDD